MDKKKALKLVKQYIAFLKSKKYDIYRSYIFGSYARGNFTDDSDIDIAIVINGLKNSFTSQIELMKLSRKIDSRIEPHPFSRIDFNSKTPFIKEIIENGIKIS